MVSSLVLVHNCFLHGLQIRAAADNDKDSERASACRAATYYPQLASRHEPPSARQRNAIGWRFAGGSTVARFSVPCQVNVCQLESIARWVL